MEAEIAELKTAMKVNARKEILRIFWYKLPPNLGEHYDHSCFVMKARSSDGPAGMVFDAVFNTPDVGAAPLFPPETPSQPVEPPKQEVSSSLS